MQRNWWQTLQLQMLSLLSIFTFNFLLPMHINYLILVLRQRQYWILLLWTLPLMPCQSQGIVFVYVGQVDRYNRCYFVFINVYSHSTNTNINETKEVLVILYQILINFVNTLLRVYFINYGQSEISNSFDSRTLFYKCYNKYVFTLNCINSSIYIFQN